MGRHDQAVTFVRWVAVEPFSPFLIFSSFSAFAVRRFSCSPSAAQF